ncbi:MAG: hypothetical protein ACOYN0_16930, partial [Phycisphaerales bacterium]
NLVSNIEARFEAGLTNHGVISAAQSVSALGGGVQDGRFVMATGATLSLGGTQTMAAASRVEGQATVAVVSGVTSFAGFLASTLSLSTAPGSQVTLGLDYSLAFISNSGTLDIGSRNVTLTGAFDQTSTGTLRVDLLDAASVGTITAATSSVDGLLDVTSSTGFDPSDPMLALYGISIVNAQEITGSMAVGAQPSLTAGSYVARMVGNSLRLLHNIADFNGDGGVDADDVILFFNAWDNGLIIGDLNGDGGVDSDDVIFFFGLWDNGGR